MGKVKKEKQMKNDGVKKKENNEKKEVLVDDGNRRYGYISSNSVTSMAEAAGFIGIQEDVAKSLAEDVTYRLRYVIQLCKKHMIHSRQKKLNCADVNEVLKMCDVPATYGYTLGSTAQDFTYIKDADVYVIDEDSIDLLSFALTEIIVHPKPNLNVSGVWNRPSDNKLKPESKDKNNDPKYNIIESIENAKGVNSCENQRTCTDTLENESKIATSLIKYYGITCNSILGHSDLKIIIEDLSTSKKIRPIVPYLLNFITITLNKLGSERQIKRILQCVDALTRNNSIDFSPYMGASRVISAMLMIIAIDKKSSKMSYDYNIRRYAAYVLSKVLEKWCPRDEQKSAVIKKMNKLLQDFKAPAKVHYGALVLLTALGAEALHTSFWNLIDQYLTYLEAIKLDFKEKTITEIAMLEDVILSASAVLQRSTFLPKGSIKSDQLYLNQCLYEYFGDASCITTLHVLENPKFMGGDKHISRQRDQRHPRIMKYMSTRYKPEIKRLTIDNVFTLPKINRKRNSRIIFKFAGAIPVPEVNLKRKRFDSTYSQFIAGKESEGHVVVVGKFWKKSQLKNPSVINLPVGSIFSLL